MRIAERALVVLLCGLLGGANVGAQQQHVVDPDAINQALTAGEDEISAKRRAILNALEQPQVKEVAERLGLNPSRAEAAVSSLDGFMLDKVAAQAQQVNDAIAGGQTVRLNLLWVIIGLLVLILIIVAA